MLSTNYVPGTRKAKSVHKPITPFSRSLSQFPCSMRRPGVSLLPLDGTLVYRKVIPQRIIKLP